MEEGFVSEYPLPPFYYKGFITPDYLRPPVCENTNLRNMCYGSSLQTSTTLAASGIVNDYKSDLLSTLKDLLHHLTIISDIHVDVTDHSSGIRMSFEEKLANINHCIGTVQRIFNDYKAHQAREDIIQLSKEKLNSALQLEATLANVLLRNQERVKQLQQSTSTV